MTSPAPNLPEYTPEDLDRIYDGGRLEAGNFVRGGIDHAQHGIALPDPRFKPKPRKPRQGDLL